MRQRCHRTPQLLALAVVTITLGTTLRAHGAFAEGLTAQVFEGSVKWPSQNDGTRARGYLYYDPTVLEDLSDYWHLDLYELKAGVTGGFGSVAKYNLGENAYTHTSQVFPGDPLYIIADHPVSPGPSNTFRVTANLYDVYHEDDYIANDVLRIEHTSFPLGSLPGRVPRPGPASTETKPTQYFGLGSKFGQAPSSLASINVSRPMTIEDIFKDSITLDPFGPTMFATFAPFGGAMSLQDAARLLGVHHFNWFQTVSGPGNVEIQVRDIPDISMFGNPPFSSAPGTLLSDAKPAVDPVISYRGSEHLVVRFDGNELNDVVYMPVNRSTTVDEFPYYLNESDPSVIGHISNFTDPFALGFVDTPRAPDWVLSGADGVAAPNYFLSFTTELVGVGFDGEPVYFDVPGTSFRWKSNAVYRDDPDTLTGGIQRAVYLSTLPTDLAPAISSGGVFDIELVGVPEPTAVALVLATFLSGVKGRRGI